MYGTVGVVIIRGIIGEVLATTSMRYCTTTFDFVARFFLWHPAVVEFAGGTTNAPILTPSS